jgi:hypothetical protein
VQGAGGGAEVRCSGGFAGRGQGTASQEAGAVCTATRLTSAPTQMLLAERVAVRSKDARVSDPLRALVACDQAWEMGKGKRQLMAVEA